MTDTGATERTLERLLAVRWDGKEAYEHPRSRSALTYEFLRRSAQWAKAVGGEGKWPFFDIAAEVESDVRADPALVDRLVAGLGDYIGFPPMRTVTEGALHWAALGDLPSRRFPELDDPFEPLLLLFERGGGFTTGNGSIELGSGSFPMRSLDFRVDLKPVLIDPVTLEALDEEG